MFTKFEKLITLILDNLFDFATIVVAGILVIRYQIVPPTQSDLPEITIWVLAILGLMAVSGIWERNRRLSRIEEVGKETREFAKQYVNGVIPASRFFIQQKLHQLPDEVFLSSQTIDIEGITLSRATREYLNIFQERLRTGANIRIIICDPQDNEVVNQMSLRLAGDFPSSYWKERLGEVELYAREIAQYPHKPGTIQIGFLPYIPAFGLINIDAQKQQGVCYVEVYHHKSRSPEPVFKIHNTDDPAWHQLFARQFEILWASCRTEDI